MSHWDLFLLGFLLVFQGSLLVVRPILTWRMTGRFPVKVPSGESVFGFAQRGLSVVLIGFNVVVAIKFLWPVVYEWIPPIPVLQTELFRQLGCVLGVMGLLIGWMSQSQMGASWRVGVHYDAPPPLVTHGIYAYSRNPIYVAIIIGSCGIFLLVPDWLMLMLMVLNLVLHQVLIRAEEDYLKTVHGANYEAYMARTGRFWGQTQVANDKREG